jgi:hypothetical protein
VGTAAVVSHDVIAAKAGERIVGATGGIGGKSFRFRSFSVLGALPYRQRLSGVPFSVAVEPRNC